MKKKPNAAKDEMRVEYDFSKGVRGKYYARAMAGTNLVLIEPELFEVFPSSAAVNKALRTFVRARSRSRKRGDQRNVRLRVRSQKVAR